MSSTHKCIRLNQLLLCTCVDNSDRCVTIPNGGTNKANSHQTSILWEFSLKSLIRRKILTHSVASFCGKSFCLDENARFFLDTIVLCDSSRYVSRSLFLHSHFLKRQSAIKFHRPVSAERVPINCVPLLWFTVTHNKLHAISLRVSTTRYAYGYSYRRNWNSFDNKKKIDCTRRVHTNFECYCFCSRSTRNLPNIANW